MTFEQAKKLHNEDEVQDKFIPGILRVVDTKIDNPHRDVYVLCDDGQWYHHQRLK